jgi:hypothetical protein
VERWREEEKGAERVAEIVRKDIGTNKVRNHCNEQHHKKWKAAAPNTQGRRDATCGVCVAVPDANEKPKAPRRGREKGKGEGEGRRGREKGKGEGEGRRGREKGKGEAVRDTQGLRARAVCVAATNEYARSQVPRRRT